MVVWQYGADRPVATERTMHQQYHPAARGLASTLHESSVVSSKAARVDSLDVDAHRTARRVTTADHREAESLAPASRHHHSTVQRQFVIGRRVTGSTVVLVVVVVVLAVLRW